MPPMAPTHCSSPHHPTHHHPPTQVLETLRDPLQTLAQGREPEVVFAVLSNFLVLAQRYPLAFSQVGRAGAGHRVVPNPARGAAVHPSRTPKRLPLLSSRSSPTGRPSPAPALSVPQLYPEFYCRFDDPSYLKALKIDCLIAVADATNAYEIAEELTQVGGWWVSGAGGGAVAAEVVVPPERTIHHCSQPSSTSSPSPVLATAHTSCLPVFLLLS